jgi:beta-lactamase superfamily II metal-dependent hydrolase
MPGTAITVEALPGGYGDCLLISCAVGSRQWRLLIDTGPDECLPTLVQRLDALPVNSSGKRRIDLAVISHIDHDHIGGASAIFADKSLGLDFGDIWFNAPHLVSSRGVSEGVGLASVLGGAARGLPWNKAFDAQDVVVPDSLFLDVPGKRGEPRITLLSPTRQSLDALYGVWAKELPKVKVRPEPEPLVVERGALDVLALASRSTAVDRAPANGSSIAFLLEHRGATALLTADAFPTVLVPALTALAAHRGTALPWKIDVLKLSHHGSRANTTEALMQVVRATDTVVSTNGAIFGHPDAEGVARVVHGCLPNSRIWFNYRTPRTALWGVEEMCRQFGYSAQYPEDGGQSVVVRVPARR